MIIRIFIAAMVLSILIVGNLTIDRTVMAHGGAKGIVKERMDLMDTIGTAVKKLNDMFNDKTPFNVEDVRANARVIEAHSGEKMVSKFPEGSLQKPSEALPAIWKNWDSFKKSAFELETYAKALQAAAGNPRKPGGGMMGQGMMGQNPMMSQNPMMGGQESMMKPDFDKLTKMPPDAAFMQVTQTCSACHTDFRAKKKK